MWIEMSRDEAHGGAGWDFTECLWSPAHKNPKGKWPFYESLLAVRRGDIVFHLRGKGPKAAFVGYSFADADGYQTTERPTVPKHWGYADTYYRVPLTNFTRFSDPVYLEQVLAEERSRLTQYLLSNKSLSRMKRQHLFYVFQSNRLQCLNGAYLSELSTELAEIIFGPEMIGQSPQDRPTRISVATGEQIGYVAFRMGQQIFSHNIRLNYNNQCCFPGCGIVDADFLVGSHIARWADASSLRGEIANGLCLCLMHDKAFESGLFTLSEDLKICINHTRTEGNSWAREHLLHMNNTPIHVGMISPSSEALRQHWQRIGFTPRSALDK